VVLEDVKFIFSTLWTNISPIKEYQIQRAKNDFYVIKFRGSNPLSIAQYNKLHADSLTFLTKELTLKAATKNVVVSHHVPTFKYYPENSIINEAFAVELIDFIETFAPDYWVYGHTHGNTPDFEIGKTKLRTNQLGYVKYEEQEDFDKKKHFIL
jgi:Icc-related predicted phosphoesterase